MQFTYRFTVASVVLSISCTSTPEAFETRRVAAQDDAGAIHFSVLSVARWEDYAEAMQPKFELDEQLALEQVVPTTQALQQTLMQLAQSRMGVQRLSDTAPEIDDNGSESSDLLLSGAGPQDHARPSVLSEDIQVDPMLRYWSATALYQEVQLLNRFVRDAAIRDGYEPYVVRLQVSVMPNARHEPYDAYTLLSFFTLSGEDQAGSDLIARADASPRVMTRGLGESGDWNTPQVVPLMVTDNLEASLRSRMVDDVRQLAASLSYFSGSGSSGFDVQSVERDLQSVFGRDLNSLLTVGRLSDNTLRVRLGAQSEATADFAMVPRTHNITVLVLIPEDSPERVQVLSKSEFVDAVTGDRLAPRTEARVRAALGEIANNYGIGDVDADAFAGLLAHVQANDQPAFFGALRNLLGEQAESFDLARSLWIDLVAHSSGSQYAATEFDVPRLEQDALDPLPQPQLLRLVEGADEKSTLVLRQAPNPGRRSLEALLQVTVAGNRYPLLPDSVRYDAALLELSLEFPSLSSYGLDEVGVTPGEVSLDLRLENASRRYDVVRGR